MKQARSGPVTGTAAAEQYFARQITSDREFARHHGNALKIVRVQHPDQLQRFKNNGQSKISSSQPKMVQSTHILGLA
jgi:hypothetical protein